MMEEGEIFIWCNTIKRQQNPVQIHNTDNISDYSGHSWEICGLLAVLESQLPIFLFIDYVVWDA